MHPFWSYSLSYIVIFNSCNEPSQFASHVYPTQISQLSPPSFMKAIEFVNNVAKIAENVNDHPIITINWRTVKLSLKSFDVNAITKRDINLAKEIEKAIANSSTVSRSERKN